MSQLLTFHYFRCVFTSYEGHHNNTHLDLFHTAEGLTFVLIPMALTITLNFMILLKTRRAGKRAGTATNHKTGAVLTCVCLTFVGSYVPYLSVVGINSIGLVVPQYINIFQMYALSLNCILNPVIFLVFNNAFRRYWRSFIWKDETDRRGSFSVVTDRQQTSTLTSSLVEAGKLSVVEKQGSEEICPAPLCKFSGTSQ